MMNHSFGLGLRYCNFHIFFVLEYSPIDLFIVNDRICCMKGPFKMWRKCCDMLHQIVTCGRLILYIWMSKEMSCSAVGINKSPLIDHVCPVSSNLSYNLGCYTNKSSGNEEMKKRLLCFELWSFRVDVDIYVVRVFLDTTGDWLIPG